MVEFGYTTACRFGDSPVPPPAGIDTAYIEDFLARNRAQLVEIIRLAFSAPRGESPLQRSQEEHRLARKVLQSTRAILTQAVRDVTAQRHR